MERSNLGGKVSVVNFDPKYPKVVPGKRRILDSWAEMIDIDPLEWRRWFDLLHHPNQAENGLYILHEDGVILTVTPSSARKTMQLPEKISNPKALAEKLHKIWKNGPVVIIDRRHLQSNQDYFSCNYAPGDDFFATLIQIKDQLLADSKKGIVIFPQPWSNWKFISPEFPAKLARLMLYLVVKKLCDAVQIR